MPGTGRIPGHPIRWGPLAGALRAGACAAFCVGVLVATVLGGPLAFAPRDWVRFSVRTPAGPEEPLPAVLRRLQPLVYARHTVRRGEWNVWAMAKAYGTTVPSLQATNNSELFLIQPGMRLMVHNKKGLLYAVAKESESLDTVVARYQRDPLKARRLKERVVAANGLPGTALLGSYELARGETLLLPDVSVEFDTYRFPFQAPGWHRVSSGFGMRLHPVLRYVRRHEGWDLPKPYGTPVYAARSGRVVYAGWKDGYGSMVEIRHADGAGTVYGHLSRVSVQPGQWAARGKTLLGRVGSSGLSTGPHLHFEVRDRRGRPVNPRAKIGRR